MKLSRWLRLARFDRGVQLLSEVPEEAVETKSVHMVRAEIDLGSFYRWAASRQLMTSGVFDDGYAMHCLLTEVFGDHAPKPFRLITHRSAHSTMGLLYGYTGHDADQLVDSAASYADPLQALTIPSEAIRTKEMPADWTRGRQLGFEVLVRPVTRRTRNADRPGTEKDVFQSSETGALDKGAAPNREDVYARWLTVQMERHGRVDVEKCRLHSFRNVRVIRKRRGPSIAGPSAVMRGTLTIGEGREFSKLLERGVGRHRSYGYGMLLLRPSLLRGGP